MADRACSDDSQHMRMDPDTKFPSRDMSYPHAVGMLEWRSDSPQAEVAYPNHHHSYVVGSLEAKSLRISYFGPNSTSRNACRALV